MNLREIEERVAAIEPLPGVQFLVDLLLAYGLPKASISRLMSGTYDKAGSQSERLWKDKVYFRFADEPDDALYALIDAARDDERVLKHRPRFLIVKNETRLLAGDQKTGATLDIAVGELAANTAFFLPWAGIEKTQLENLNYADVKAAEKMAKLYDEVIKHNSIETEVDIHALNVFFSRLLFCFFAEDTGVFEVGSFTNGVASYTRESGEDTHAFLDQLFDVLDRDLDDRDGVPEHLQAFGYVNGNLFANLHPAPRFSARARAVILECGTLDWSQINPDIFGSMIQAVVHPSQREGLGMHYTSVENIMKVIRPLFLDELEEAFDRADTTKKLERLLERISRIQIFDPACGSGNFLVISYKELRKLEHRILQRLVELDPKGGGLFKLSVLKLESFYGIEIDDFAHEIAILSLWLAKHQMNVEFEELFGAEIPLIPLQDSGNVICGNAARLDWSGICDPRSGRETYVCGNPPYQGARLQSAAQKADLTTVAGDLASNDLDYVSAWFLKGASYVAAAEAASLGFVATNSICQGQHVSLLWPTVYATGADIEFAVQAFRWRNQAKGGAGVTCVVIGLQPANGSVKRLYSGQSIRRVTAITPYLTAGTTRTARTIVNKTASPGNGLPELSFGSMPNDGGGLILNSEERRQLVAAYPDAADLTRRFLGAREFIQGHDRWALWISAANLSQALAIPPVAERVARVERYRGASKRKATRRLAEVPYRFGEIRHRDTPAILVPRVSSERREYVPMDFVGPDTVISDSACAIYDAELWLFGLIQSRMHMVWTRAVAGRIKTDLRYSGGLVYNTFPVPDLDGDAMSSLRAAAVGVLAAREQFPESTLADLYDPQEMPGGLRRAHADLDETVDRLYGSEFESDESRLQLLMEMYEIQRKDAEGTDA